MKFRATAIMKWHTEGTDRNLYRMEFPTPAGWRMGVIRIIDGEMVRIVTAPRMART
jgi:hypothetical protein